MPKAALAHLYMQKLKKLAFNNPEQLYTDINGPIYCMNHVVAPPYTEVSQ